MAVCDYVDAIAEKVNMLSLWDFFGNNLKIKCISVSYMRSTERFYVPQLN